MSDNEKELDQYGVWVKSGEAASSEESASSESDLNLAADDIQIDLEDKAVNEISELEDFSFNLEEESSNNEELIGLSLEEQNSEEPMAFDEGQEFYAGSDESEEFFATDFAETNSEENSSEMSSSENTSENFIDVDNFNFAPDPEDFPTIEEEISLESEEKNQFQTTENQGEEEMNGNSEILQTILAEIKNIKNDIDNIKVEINELKNAPAASATTSQNSEDPFDDEDEVIALSDDELNNFSAEVEESEGELTLDNELASSQELTLDNELELNAASSNSFVADDAPISVLEDDLFDSNNDPLKDLDLGEVASFDDSELTLEEELAQNSDNLNSEEEIFSVSEESELPSFEDEEDSILTSNSSTEVDEELELANEIAEITTPSVETESSSEINFDSDFSLEDSSEGNPSEESFETETVESNSFAIDQSELDDLDFSAPAEITSEDVALAAAAAAQTLNDDVDDYEAELIEDESLLSTPDAITEATENFEAQTESKEASLFQNKDLVDLLTYLDSLLDSLPDEKVKEFASSPYFELYKKVFKELGIQ